MLKKLFVPLMLTASCALFFVACGGSDNTTNTSTNTTTGANKTTTTSTPTVNPTPTTTTPATGEKIGVPECDDFLAKYEACLKDKIPGTAKAQFEASLSTWRKSWQQAASTAQGKSSLAMVCKAALDQTKTSMKPYGCEF